MNQICVDGKRRPAGEAVLNASNRGYRYGDGLFETMKIVRGSILLESYHFNRLFAGMELLQFKVPRGLTRRKLRDEILGLAQKNNCSALARVRLSAWRGDGGLYDPPAKAGYLVECSTVPRTVNKMNAAGLVIDIFPDARKSPDRFANLKSANYLPYVMGARYAMDRGLDDCLICNTAGRIADATIANIFLVKNDLVITPSLGEGCVDGVMRKYLLENLPKLNFRVREDVVTENDLASSDEVFLTNAVSGARWVERFRRRKFRNTRTRAIFRDLIAPLYS